jgi:hypothetical protein
MDSVMCEEVTSIAGGFLENKDDCDWNCEFVKIGDRIFDKILKSREELLDYVQKLLEKNIKSFDLTKISSDKFNYLSQQ